MPVRLDAAAADFDKRLAGLIDRRRADEADAERAAAEIIRRVRAEGDAAVIDLTRRFDRVELSPETMRIGADEVAAASARCGPKQRAALEQARDRIEAYHRRQLPEDADWRDEAGLRLGWRWRPVDAVGLYVPGGTAAYPSSVLMNAVPAKVAGVPRLVMAVPTPDGALNPLVLAAAQLAGVDEIYRIGGAQAIAALAYGTRTIRPVEKIVGPGNAYVAAAKRQVFGQVGIDVIAGPSEILVVAERGCDPDWIAADLLSQAEHDAQAQAILVTDSAELADRVTASVERLLANLPRAEIARASWDRHGAIILVPDLDAAAPVVDAVAPEHLELALADPEPLLARIRHAGAIFLGPFAPEAVGDYVAGPSHVLPTSGGARFASGLGVLDFLKRSSIIGLDRRALERVGPAARTLAEAEGLGAHALSVALRLDAGER
ncbi:MAG TPA: histidinol dehydrogenase [Alphaproteobacteria bacterium]